MRRRLVTFLPALIVLGLVLAATAAGPSQETGQESGEAWFDSRSVVRPSIEAAALRVAPGSRVPVVVVFDIATGWHIWTNDRELEEGVSRFDGAYFTLITLDAPEGGAFIRGGIAWPSYSLIESDLGLVPETFAVFEGRVVVPVALTVAPDAPLGAATLTAKVTFQACDERSCKGPVVDLELPLAIEIVSAEQAQLARTDGDFAAFPQEIFGEQASNGAGATSTSVFKITLPWIGQMSLNVAGAAFVLLLLIAAIGGFLLNLTPCVLPVIPIKIMGLSAAAGNRPRMLALGTMMTLGVITMWLAIGASIALIQGFTAISQLFQGPTFPIAVGLIVAVMGVGMLGLFAVRLPQFVYALNPSHDSLGGSFGFGIMTGVLSTPCTAPFMGAAAAYAATVPPLQTILIFAAIGAGMALPYQILSTFPHLVERMPRTGPASELIKQVMGLLMLAVAVFFVGTGLSIALVRPPEPANLFFWWVVALFGAVAGLWLAWRTLRITRKPVRRLVFGGLGVLIAAASVGVGVVLTDRGPIEWIYYTPQRFAEAKQSGKVVVMDFTAEWCLTCKAMERAVLHSDRISRILGEPDVAPIKVDLTGDYAEGRAMLAAAGWNGIPLLVVYRADGSEIFKSDFYTADQVEQAIADARGAAQVAAGGN